MGTLKESVGDVFMTADLSVDARGILVKFVVDVGAPDWLKSTGIVVCFTWLLRVC